MTQLQSKKVRTVSHQETLSEEALDFVPGLLAIQESPPAKLPRAVLYTVMALFTILLAWALFGKLDIVASAEGRLVPQTYVKIVQPADAGIVQEILVKEGEKVRAGQVVMRMDPQVALADETSIKNDLALKRLQIRRIDAELNSVQLTRTHEDPDDIFQQVVSQYREHRQAYQDAIAQAQQALKRAEHDAIAARQVLIKLREITPILKDQALSMADLAKEGYVPQSKMQDKQREFVEKEQVSTAK